MRTLGHLLKFELRRHRWSIAVLIGVMTAMLAQLRLDPAVPDEISKMEGVLGRTALGTIVAFATVVVWLSLVASVMQGESAADVRAAWRTRPISWGAMLGSRVAAVVVIALLPPWLLQVVTLLSLGGPLGATLDAATGTLLTFALFALPALLAAALTPNLGMFWLATVGGVVALSLSFSGVLAAQRAGGAQLSGSKMFVAFTTAGLGSALLLVWLYARRARRGATIGACLLYAAVFAVVLWWRWPMPRFLVDSGRPPPAVVPVPAGFGLDSAARTGWVRKPGKATPIGVRMRVAVGLGTYRLLNVKGEADSREGGRLTLHGASWDRRTRLTAIVSEMTGGSVTLLHPDRPDSSSMGLSFALPEGNPARFTRIAAKLRFERVEWTDCGEVPLKVGAVWRRDAARLEITEFGVADGRLRIGLRSQVVARRLGDPTEAERAASERLFVVLNRARREALVVDRTTNINTLSIETLPGFRRAWQMIDVARPSGLGDPERWLADAVLIVVRERAVEAFDLPVEFPLPELPASDRP